MYQGKNRLKEPDLNFCESQAHGMGAPALPFPACDFGQVPSPPVPVPSPLEWTSEGAHLTRCAADVETDAQCPLVLVRQRWVTFARIPRLLARDTPSLPQPTCTRREGVSQLVGERPYPIFSSSDSRVRREGCQGHGDSLGVTGAPPHCTQSCWGWEPYLS